MITKYFEGYVENKPAMSREELNRDITLWYCRSLRSFEDIEHEATADFL